MKTASYPCAFSSRRPKDGREWRIETNLNTELFHPVNFFFDKGTRQPELRDAVKHHATGFVGGFKQGHRISHQGQIMGAGKT